MLVCRCDGLTQAHMIDLFVVGLRKPLRIGILLKYPMTLKDAMDQARAYEDCDKINDDWVCGSHKTPTLSSCSLIHPDPCCFY
jgi:hypothetical protein